MTDEDRARAQRLRDQLQAQAVAGADVRKEKFALISKMLLAYPVANASAESGRARGEAYLEALDDIPPAALADAIRRWHRGEAGEHDYRWPPAPAVLRAICAKMLDPIHAAIHDIDRLLSAISLERAMDPRPLEMPAEVPTLRKIA